MRGPILAAAVAASRWRRNMKILLNALAIATLVASPALAASYQSASQSLGAHAYAKSHEAGDYKYCMKGTGAGVPGCAFDSMEQCMANRNGIGGVCYGK